MGAISTTTLLMTTTTSTTMMDVKVVEMESMEEELWSD